LPAVGASITAFYMFRMWFLVFAGEPRGYPAHAHGYTHSHGHDDHHHGNPYDHAHESGPLMAWPLLALAVPAVLVGWTWQFGIPIDEPVLEHMLTYGEPLRGQDLWSMHWLAFAASILIAFVGIGAGVAYYAPPLAMIRRRPVPIPLRRRFRAETAASRFPGLYTFLKHKWYFDELYDATLVRPTLALARGLGVFDKQAVDGVVNSAARLTELLSRLEGVFDRLAVDGLVNLVGQGVYVLGDWGRMIQTGRLRNYLMFLAVALVGIFAGVFAWVH
jgi:NADH:ubiquinone oxidoreductase subunit 5 (subunit L)/multisubunit Na+/H+ antiporter MnhA subunit